MKAKTEEFLFVMAWSLEMFRYPNLKHAATSLENWAARNNCLRELHELEHRKYMESIPGTDESRLQRLTEKALAELVGNRNPVEWWNRPWDGLWRIVSYDVPLRHNSRRERLRRFLRSRHFGRLQKSLWICPDSLADICELVSGMSTGVRNLVMLEATSAAGESPQDMVLSAWNFPRINRCYSEHLQFLDTGLRSMRRERWSKSRLRSWIRSECDFWQTTVALDPFLPETLLPPGYLGKKAWSKRHEVLKKAAKRLRNP